VAKIGFGAGIMSREASIEQNESVNGRSMKAMKIWLACGMGAGFLLPAADAVEFEKPARLKGGGEFIRVESPGFAAPCHDDIDGDGKKDLLVGQFRDGKIRVFKGLGGERFARGEWLRAEGKVATVPGVW
jgi:hypothetical protein